MKIMHNSFYLRSLIAIFCMQHKNICAQVSETLRHQQWFLAFFPLPNRGNGWKLKIILSDIGSAQGSICCDAVQMHIEFKGVFCESKTQYCKMK